MTSGVATVRARRHAHLPGSLEILVRVDLDPLDLADLGDADLEATVGELLVAVLVVELRVAPGRLVGVLSLATVCGSS